MFVRVVTRQCAARAKARQRGNREGTAQGRVPLLPSLRLARKPALIRSIGGPARFNPVPAKDRHYDLPSGSFMLPGGTDS